MNIPTYELEEELISYGYREIAGVDEAGRGPGAGPVVAAAVIIPDEEALLELTGKVNDSKKLSAKKRGEMAEIIKEVCEFSYTSVDNVMIDEINILQATRMAMAIAAGRIVPDYILIDGNSKMRLDLDIDQETIIQGDSKSISIAAASIIAKTERDKIMMALHEKYPIYGWDKNKGYLTKAHIEAIQKYGPSEYHRYSFRKVGR